MNDHLNISLTTPQMDYIASVLMKRPWEEVNQLLLELQRQVQEQQHARLRQDAVPVGTAASVGNGHDLAEFNNAQ